MLISRRLILAHFWLAFAVFGVALLLGAWQMFVRSPLQRLDQQSGILLPLGHRARHGDGLCVPDPGRDGLRLCDHAKSALEQPLVGRRWAWAGFCAGRRRRRDGDGPGRAGPRLGALHLLSADDRQPLLLHRRRAGRGRLLDLGRADVDQSARSGSATIPASRCRWRCSPMSRAPISGAGPRSAPRSNCCSRSFPVALGLTSHDRCRAGARVLLLDAARDRLFLADADLYRLLHDRAARDRRPALQRRDGADRLHPVPGRGDADRHAPPLRRSAGRRRLQVHAFGLHRRWSRCRRC